MADRASFETQLRDFGRKGLVYTFCTDSEMQIVRDLGGTMRYRYSDKNGELLGTLEVSKRDCSNPP